MIEIAAELVKEFHGMTPETIPELDRWWIRFVYFARRDKYGALMVRSKRDGGQTLSTRDAWIRNAERVWGYPTWYAARQYAAMVADAKAKARAKAKAKMAAKAPIIVSAMPKRGRRG